MDQSRRNFIKGISQATGVLVLAPVLTRCSSSDTSAATTPGPVESTSGAETASSLLGAAIPQQRPADWDPIQFNRDRGNAGAIPLSYQDEINGPDGEAKHLGKHLPFVPPQIASAVPVGYLAIMWGDPSKGHAKHPNAAPSEENPEGHWYNWIRIRKSSADPAQEQESRYSSWPLVSEGDSGQLAAEQGTDPSADEGRNTVYLAALPEDVAAGDWIRIHAHCKTHGEYVDFIQVPTA